LRSAVIASIWARAGPGPCTRRRNDCDPNADSGKRRRIGFRESALRKAGALFEGETHPKRDCFANHYVADGNLITGQNQNAGPMTARLMMQRVLALRHERN
jgi:hypothetical protein